MSHKRRVDRAVSRAEIILSSREKERGDSSTWQAIIAVGEFVETDPIAVCDFALKWARRPGKELQAAISCCLIEHLLEFHFDLVLPRMRQAARESIRVADHFENLSSSVFKFGDSTRPENIAKLQRLGRELQRSRVNRKRKVRHNKRLNRS